MYLLKLVVILKNKKNFYDIINQIVRKLINNMKNLKKEI